MVARLLVVGSNFYSRPCGRGDLYGVARGHERHQISTHAPAGGATLQAQIGDLNDLKFLLTPLREGRH